jgi:hypothetical protein
MVAFSGFNESHEPPPAMPKVSYRRITTAIKMASKVGKCCIAILFAVALAAAWAIQSK